MKFLAFGRSGQVGQELAGLGVQTFSRQEADLNDPLKCAAMIAASGANAVINAAAYTAVDSAEEDEATAHMVNAKAPAAMAQTCAAMGVPFVHISTDYVFDGSGEKPWISSAPTAPLGAYGRTKLEGEQGVRAAVGTFAILRTSWVFSAHGANFVKTMLRLGAERDALSVVADQIGGPTPARDIAAACVSLAEALIADPGKSGTYHFAGRPDVSWADFAREIFDQAKLQCAVTDIPTSAYPTPAVRPKNSRLDCTSTETVFGVSRPDWRLGLAQVLSELNES